MLLISSYATNTINAMHCLMMPLTLFITAVNCLMLLLIDNATGYFLL